MLLPLFKKVVNYTKKIFLFFLKKKKKVSQANWKSLIHKNIKYWNKKINSIDKNKKVLIATSIGGHSPVTTIESLIGVALTLRNAEVHFLLCDEILSLCLQCKFSSFKYLEKLIDDTKPGKLCKNCFKPAYKMFKGLKLKVLRYSKFISGNEFIKAKKIAYSTPINDIKNYKIDNISLGEHAYAGALRFFAKGTINDEEFNEEILRKYFHASIVSMIVIRNLYKKYQYDCAMFNHGIYIPQGIIGDVSRENNIRVVNWNPAYRKKCFIFSHTDTYHHTLMNESIDKWENLILNDKQKNEIKEYLKSRWYHTNDWIWFHEKPDEKIEKISKELGIDFNKNCIGLLTNVFWDAQLHYPTNIFENMLVWIIKTIEYFSNKLKELQLIIRIHPAEIRGTVPSRQKIVDEILKKFPILPKNIFIIHPESPISTYAIMEQCKTVIIYGTKMGVELTTMGIPVIVAGEAWIKNKGITYDPKSKDEYFRLLNKLPLKPMSEALIDRALKYAYHFFFRRMIPLNFMGEPKKNMRLYSFYINDLSDLDINKDLGLDVICDGILNGSDFIYKAEENEKYN